MEYKRVTNNLIALFFVVLLMNSCTRNNIESLSKPMPPVNGCDTLHVTYSLSVKPVLKNNCYSCHSTAATISGGLDLEDFSSLRNYLNYYYHNDSIFGSKFSHIINQNGVILYMPPTGKLTDCELSIINKWIQLGAPAN